MHNTITKFEFFGAVRI